MHRPTSATGKFCLTAALAAFLATYAGAAPAQTTTAPPAARRFQLPITLSAPKGAEPTTQPAGSGLLPFDFSASKAMESTKLPTPAPKVVQAPQTVPTPPAPVPAPVVVQPPTPAPAPMPADAPAVATAPTPAPAVTPNPPNVPAPPSVAKTNPDNNDHPHPESPDADTLGLGGTPQPTPAIKASYNEIVTQIVDPENTLDLVVGKPRIMVLAQAPQKIQIPDEKVCAYDILSEKELSVTGVSIGTTVLNLWFEDKNAPSGHRLLGYYVRVVSDPETKMRVDKVYHALELEINKAFPNSHIHLELVGRNLVVTGEAKDASEASKIIRVLESNAVGTGELNAPRPGFVGVKTPGVDSGAPGTPNATADTSAQQGDNQGAAATSSTDVLALAHNGVGGGGGGEGRNRNNGGGGGEGGYIINMLRVPGENQVMIRVTVAEVNRDAARNVGLNFTISNSKNTPILANLTGGLGSFTAGAQGGQFPMLLDKGQVGVTLDALQSISLARSLAEPNLVAINGQRATFLAGGKFPVPVVTGATATGLQGVQYIPFGISLNFTPFVTEKDMIRLQFTAEVSTRDATTGTTINGGAVAGIDTRNIETTVDLKPGQTLAVAGLIQTNYAAGGNRIPFIGELPVLANLLGQSQASTSEQELVMLISAELVRPMDPNKVPPLPGHDIYEPSEAGFFLEGRLESPYGPDFRSPTRTDWDFLTRRERLQRSYLYGPTGYSDGRTGEETPRANVVADPVSK